MLTMRFGCLLVVSVLGLAMRAAASDSTAPVPVATSTTTLRRTDLNEMQGKFQSKGDDPKSLRILVDGGFNVEFTYDAKTAMKNGGSPIAIEDLNYGDLLIVRYAGKDLYAVELDRLSKASQP